MQSFTDAIWITDQSQRVYGLELGARMTVVDLGDGELLVHSPIRLNSGILDSLRNLGAVRYVVAPNKWHHLYLGDFRQAFPSAKFFCSPGLEKKREDFRFDGVIDKSQSYPWNPTLEHILVGGVPMYNEVVLFHPRSRTLILTDFAVHICESKSLRTKLWLRLLGSYGKFGWSSLEKKMFIRDKEVFKKTVDAILEWDFDRIIVSHGTPVESDGKLLLRQAFQ